MSDSNSSLPVRTESDGDIVVKVSDGTTPSQHLAIDANGKVTVKLTDAAGNGITSQTNGAQRALDVGIDVGGVQIDPRQVRSLVFASDKVDASGSVVALDAPTLAALESITVQNGAGTSAVNIQDGGNSITVDAIDLDIRDLTHVSDSIKIGDGTDFLAVNTDGSINVVIADGTPGTAINNYNTVAAVAAAATSNHDYTVTAAKTFYLNQIEATASGKAKIEVQVETGVASGVFNTKFVQFNSTAETNMPIHLDNPITVAAGVRVRVIRTNKDNQSQDLYSTISGYELP